MRERKRERERRGRRKERKEKDAAMPGEKVKVARPYKCGRR